MSVPKVLVIEDDPLIGQLLCDLLELSGFQVQGATCGSEGLKHARESAPDAVVLDVMLPDIDGYQICASLKSDGRTAEIGVLMLTCLAAYPDRVRAFEVGADRFMTKPFQPDEIIDELHSLTDARNGYGKGGLRRRVTLEFSDEEDLDRQVQTFLGDLLRTTPLAPEDIELEGSALRQVGRYVFRQHDERLLSGCLKLACEIYRDRLEHTLEVEPAGVVNDDMLYHILSEPAPGRSTAPADVLNDEGTGSRSPRVLVRHFSNDK